MNIKTSLVAILLSAMTMLVNAQVIISDKESPAAIDASAILHLDSEDKGLRPPKVALQGLNSTEPLTSNTLTEGMLVYNTGSALPWGYYYWDGQSWARMDTSADEELNVAVVTTTYTLDKSENMVLASAEETGVHSITVTLPDINAEDNGLAITVKNNGSHTDLILVEGYSGTTMDGFDSWPLRRHEGITFVAYGGSWYSQNYDPRVGRFIDVHPMGSFTTIQEVIDYLELHMDGKYLIRLCGRDYAIEETVVIDLDYPVSIQGFSHISTTFIPGSTLSGEAMFDVKSETSFSFLNFNTQNTGYGESPNEDAILLSGAETYYEMNGVEFSGFYNSVNISQKSDIKLSDMIFSAANHAAVLINTDGNQQGVYLEMMLSDFRNNNIALHLENDQGSTVEITGCGLYPGDTHTGVLRDTGNFTNIGKIFITACYWDNSGELYSGFDYSLDRDKNVLAQGNIGVPDSSPRGQIDLVGNDSWTVISDQHIWYKIEMDTQEGVFSSYSEKWTINGNQVTYASDFITNVIMFISGNITGERNE
ncbi:MAG: hypothetical protein R6U62_06325, partial [Bacteroidales bacterium]